MKTEIDIEQMDFLEAAVVKQLRKNGYSDELIRMVPIIKTFPWNNYPLKKTPKPQTKLYIVPDIKQEDSNE